MTKRVGQFDIAFSRTMFILNLLKFISNFGRSFQSFKQPLTFIYWVKCELVNGIIKAKIDYKNDVN